MRSQVGEAVAKLQAEVESLRPARIEALAAVPERHRQTFERLAERFDGEALSALKKPDRRREEYLCEACHMDLVVNVYNRLHSRDELIFCTSCGRILYIPEDLPPEVAVNSRGKSQSQKEGTYGAAAPKTKRAPKVVEKLDPAERRAKGKLGDALAAAQGESVKIALDAEEKPIEFEVIVDGKPRGTYKGRDAENLTRVIKLRLEEANIKGEVEVREKAQPAIAEPAVVPAAEPPTVASKIPEPVAATFSSEPEPVSQEAPAADEVSTSHEPVTSEHTT
jgi:hypothetical protein